MKTVIIQGSSNPEGNTQIVANQLAQNINADVIFLGDKTILPFDYEFKNQNDDFNRLIHDILDHYDAIVFATPVYWYTMSGIIKNFLDRFTDGLLHDKTLGEKFTGKTLSALACGSAKEPIEGFYIPFQKSAMYLKMNYLGDVHLWVENGELSKEADLRLQSFAILFN